MYIYLKNEVPEVPRAKIPLRHNSLLVGLGSKGDVKALPCSQGIGAEQAGNSPDEQLNIVNGVSGHDSLVQVRVKGHLLDVGVLAEVNKGLTGRVGPGGNRTKKGKFSI